MSRVLRINGVEVPKVNTVLSLIEALDVYFSIPLIELASNRAWAFDGDGLLLETIR